MESKHAIKAQKAKNLAGGLLALALLSFGLGPVGHVFAADMKADLNKIKSNEDKIKDIKNRKDKTVEKIHKSQSAIADIQQDLEKATRELEASSRRYEAAQKEVEELTHQLITAQGNWEDTLDQGQKRLRRMYMFRQYKQANELLESKNLPSLMRRIGYFSYLAKHDEDTLNDIKLQKEKLSRLQYQQMLKRQVLGKQAHEQAEAKQKFAFQKQREAEYLRRLNNDKAYYEREENALEAESRAIAQRLQSLFQSERSGNTFNIPLGTGHMIMPVRGVMTSPYGWRVHPIFGTRRLHTGQDWGVDSGTPVHAADGGTVIEAGWVGGYGKCVMIDHGKGIVTLYGHNSEIYVRPGQHVMQGQVISASGSTGNSTGPHLHLEVRLNGEPVNPLPYFH